MDVYNIYDKRQSGVPYVGYTAAIWNDVKVPQDRSEFPARSDENYRNIAEDITISAGIQLQTPQMLFPWRLAVQAWIAIVEFWRGSTSNQLSLKFVMGVNRPPCAMQSTFAHSSSHLPSLHLPSPCACHAFTSFFFRFSLPFPYLPALCLPRIWTAEGGITLMKFL